MNLSGIENYMEVTNMMTASDRAKQYRSEARRYKRKYLILKHRVYCLKNAMEKVSLGPWYVGRMDGKPEDVITLEDAFALIDKCLKEKPDED